MPRLIIVNGPPGCGKSTLAARYAEDHPLTLNLDIDRIRDLIGGWRGDPHEAGLLARAAALAAAHTHLAAGHDVIVPQFLRRPAFLEQVDELAAVTGVRLLEIVLMDSKDNALRRFAARPTSVPLPATELATMYDELLAMLSTRPRAVIVPTVHGEVEEAYEALLACLPA
jgi:predicted kinase